MRHAVHRYGLLIAQPSADRLITVAAPHQIFLPPLVRIYLLAGEPEQALDGHSSMPTTSEVVDDPRSAERALWEGLR